MYGQSRLIRVMIWSGATLLVAANTYPLLYAIACSFKRDTELFNGLFWPTAIQWTNYAALFTGVQPFGQYLLNSLGVATATVALSLALSLLASYALGRIQFAGRSLLLVTLLAISMFPQVAVLSGMFELIQALGLYNKAVGLVVPYTMFTLPFTIWVLTSFMREMPGELEEAAVMDGCNPIRIVFLVFLPLLWPALASTALLAFIGAWNEFLFSLTFVVDDTQRTVPVGMSLIAGATTFEVPWGTIMAASVVVTLPLLLIVLFLQRRIVSGLTAGAVKG